MSVRNLVLVLGDQLDRRSAAFDGFDPKRDAVWMAEVENEASHVWAHKLRIAFFFAAMRHFRDGLRKRVRVHYHELTSRRSDDRGGDFGSVLSNDVEKLRPERLVVVEPGDYRVMTELRAAADRLGVALEIRADRHFYCSTEEFRSYAADRSGLLLENFYRAMRKRHGVLLTAAGAPVGGQWNLDRENRKSFGRRGPGDIPAPPQFRPDETTAGVLDLVAKRWPDRPGSLDRFDLPVTPQQARHALRDFVAKRLPLFGDYEDAMWAGERFLYHSRLSALLNVKLLDPRACVEAAVAAYHAGDAPLNAVEGYIRQVLGWREFVRGVYHLHMPGYAGRNHLRATRDVPPFYWTGETDMACVREAMRSVLEHGYTHHIQRLMVLGNLAMTYGVHPLRFHEWHVAMYLDSVDWASLPNALGMSQHGDGGIVGTKPYCATGKYVDRMSDHCRHCRYDPAVSVGDDACPLTTFYWDFLARHADRFRDNPRMFMQVRNVERKATAGGLGAIRSRAAELRREWSGKRPQR